MTPCSYLPLKSASALAATLAMLLALVGCSPKTTPFNSMDVTGASWGQEFSLPDLQGKRVSSKDFPGKLTVVFFGFMYCPDACPTHLTKMGRVKELMGKDADRLQLVFITVDPVRDTPEKLAKYLASFDPSIVGLRGTPEEVDAVAKNFRVFYKKVDTKASATDPMAYTIDHTTFSYVLDGTGQLRLVIAHDIAEDKIASDFENLLSR